MLQSADWWQDVSKGKMLLGKKRARANREG